MRDRNSFIRSMAIIREILSELGVTAIGREGNGGEGTATELWGSLGKREWNLCLSNLSVFIAPFGGLKQLGNEYQHVCYQHTPIAVSSSLHKRLQSPPKTLFQINGNLLLTKFSGYRIKDNHVRVIHIVSHNHRAYF